GRAARRAGRDALALQVAHLRDAAAVDADDVHAVGVEDHERAQRHLVALELVLAAVRVLAGVRHREGDVRLAAADELQVVDRAAGDLGGRLHAGDVLRQHRGDAAAHRVVDAAGAAGRDRDVLRRRGERDDESGDERERARDRAMHLVSWVLARRDRFCNATLAGHMRVVPVAGAGREDRECGIARNWRRETALIRRSSQRGAGILDPDRLAGAPFMSALSTRLTSKRLYIADLAARLDAMESGRTPMDAVAYRLYARRLGAVIAAYPADLLAT